MTDREKDPTRRVNPAARKDVPGEEAPRDPRPSREAQVRPAQGATLNPRDAGGISE